MKKNIFLVIAGLLFFVTGLNAQWKPLLSQPEGIRALSVCNGTIWGYGDSGDTLYVSADTGTSWTGVLPTSTNKKTIFSLTPISADSAIVVCSSNSILKGFLTSDKGRTWSEFNLPTQDLFFNGTISAYIVGGANSILKNNKTGDLVFQSENISVFGKSYFYHSTDVGKTWVRSASALPMFLYWVMAPSGDIYSLIQRLAPQRYDICKSSDNGYTWNIQSTLQLNADSLGVFGLEEFPDLTVDTCNLYLGGSDIFPKDDPLLKRELAYVLTSHDEGLHWNRSLVSSTNSEATGSGGEAMTTSPHAVYRAADGIYRSTDGGGTWENIGDPFGGPNVPDDRHGLIAINDSVLIAYDKDLHLCRKLDAAFPYSPPQILSLPNELFSLDTINTCDSSIVRMAAIRSQTCPPIFVVSQKIVGLNAPNYVLIDSLPSLLSGLDTITILFQAPAQGDYNAQYIATFNNGSKIVIPLKGYASGVSSVIAVFDSTRVLFQQDTIGGEIHIPIRLRRTKNILSLSMKVAYDTGRLEYKGSFSKSGNILQEDRYPNLNEFRLTFNSDNLSDEDTVGYLNFLSFIGNGGCTDIHFSSLELGTSFVTPCSMMVDSNLTITVCSETGCGREILTEFLRHQVVPSFSITPNPSFQKMSIISKKEILASSVEIIDALGVQREKKTNMKITPKGEEIDIHNLSSGIYILRINSNGASNSLHFIVAQ